MTGLAATFRRPFPAQVEALRLRLANPVGTARWDDLRHEAHERAFVVAGALKADVLADLAEAVRGTIEDGRTLEWFRAEFRRIVEERGWHGWTGEGTAKGEAWRTRVIYRTNMLTSYAAGRMAQLVEAGYRLWIYRHGGSRDPRPHHLAWDGLVLPPGHPFWATHAPPNGWGCSCRIRGADSPEGARRKGGDPGKPPPEGWDGIDPRTGAPPGIDKGWAYGVGRSVADEVAQAARLVSQKVETLPAPIGADLAAANAPAIEAAWQGWITRAVLRKEPDPGFLGALPRVLLEALAAKGEVPQSAALFVRPGLVAGPKAQRHVVAGDALGEAQWRALRQMVATPRAVFRDTRTGRLVIILDDVPDGDGRGVQLAVEVDALLKRPAGRGARPANLVTSAYRVRLADVADRVAGGLLAGILGGLG